jgi:ABC-type nickel/cobalt efflux system permease component RcnA
MSKFWQVISAVVLAVVIVVMLQKPTTYDDTPHPALEPVCAGLLVTAVWAIAFRRQIEQRRISLFAMFVLVTLLAIWFAADQYFNPNGW